jgi:hypothetical protein
MQNQMTILTHAVLISLSRFIPIPFVDDWVKNYFGRRMAQALAASYGHALTPEETALFAVDQDSSLLGGCLYLLLVYPLKWLMRKLFLVIEWQRAVDQVSHSYYHGYLLDHAFSHGWHTPGSLNSASLLRAALVRARAGANTTLVKQVVRASLEHNRMILFNSGQVLYRDLARTSRVWRRGVALALTRRLPARLRNWLQSKWKIGPFEAEMAQSIEQDRPQDQPEFVAFIAKLRDNIVNLPRDHFSELEDRLAAELGHGEKPLALPDGH